MKSRLRADLGRRAWTIAIVGRPGCGNKSTVVHAAEREIDALDHRSVARRRRAASTSSRSESRGGPERTRPDRRWPFLIHRLAAVGGIGGNEHGTCAINSSRHPYPQQPTATGRNDNNRRIIAFTISDRKYQNSRLQWALDVRWLHDTANWCVTVKQHTNPKALNINYCTCIKIEVKRRPAVYLCTK